MPSRTFHHKTRHGCVGCKQRRKKCDLQRPRCGPCTKRRDLCTYDWMLTDEGEVRSLVAVPPHFSPRPALNAIDDSVMAILKLRIPLVEMTDIELIYHFQYSFGSEFDTLPTLRPVRRLNLLREAPKYPFLLHGLLAASALHLQTQATTRHRRSFYKRRTLIHNQVALSYYKASLCVIDERTCHSIFAFSVLLAGLEFNLQQQSRECFQSTRDVSVQRICGVFDLLQGVVAVVNSSRAWIQECQIDLSMTPFLLPAQGLAEDISGCVILDSLINNIKTIYVGTGDPNFPEDSMAIRTAVSELHIVYGSWGQRSPGNLMAIISWPARVGKRFVSMLKRHHPAALVVLAYYGLAICPLDSLWWLNGIGARLIKSVADLMKTSSSVEWQNLVAWPVIRSKYNHHLYKTTASTASSTPHSCPVPSALIHYAHYARTCTTPPSPYNTSIILDR